MPDSRTIGESFETNQKSITILRELLPSAWLIRDYQPDVHIDYIVEIVESGEPTGINFAVQLKGAQPKKGKAFQLRHALKTKHLRYYVEKATLPVFVILVDVTNRKGFWCFTQKFARESIDLIQITKQKTATLLFSPEDSLDNLFRFKAAIESAIKYVRDLHPGSISASVEAKKVELRGIDPRMDVQIDFREGHQHFTVSATEPFHFKANVTAPKTPEMAKAWTDFLEKGTELKLKPSELCFEGAPLLNHLFSDPANKGLIGLQFGRDVPGTLQIYEAGDSPMLLFQLDGKFRCGMKYATFEGSLENSPVTFTSTLSEDGLASRKPHNLNLSLQFEKWVGQRLLQLAFFDMTCRFVKNLHDSKQQTLKLLSLGNHLVSGNFEEFDPNQILDAYQFLKLLEKARFVFRSCHLNPTMPTLTSISASDAAVVGDLYNLLRRGEVRTPQPYFRLTMTVYGGQTSAHQNGTGILRIHSPKYEFNTFGSKIELGPVEHYFTGTKIVKLTHLSDGRRELILEGEEKSEWVMQYDSKLKQDGK